MHECANARGAGAALPRDAWHFPMHFCVSASAHSSLPFYSPSSLTPRAPRRSRGGRPSVWRRCRHEADQLAAQERTLLGELRRLEVEREIKAEELKQADAQVQEVTRQLEDTAQQMQALGQQEAAERPGLRARLVEAYKLGQGRYLRMLLSTSDLRRIGQATRTVAVLARMDRERIAEHQRTLAQLTAERAKLERRQRLVTAARADARHAEQEAVRAAAARDALIQDIDRRRDLNAQFTGELQSAQQKLQLALRALAGGEPAPAIAALPIGPFRGDLPWPVTGSVRQRFGGQAGTRATSSNGMEIGAAEGTSVVAVYDGVVAFAGSFAGFGNLVILDHGSKAFSLYGNLLEMTVKKGDQVERGQAVGTVGAPPAGQPGLYFELRVDDRPVDPLQWLKKTLNPRTLEP